ncbi:MAG: hypothetical protein JO091_10485 [Acidobacteriaceae bacterium]|nr:hypothetical protein [Acidobacteriaceae bacterium]
MRREQGSKRTSEQGSALLIVFVFAAMVAIMLYRELPVAAFEAERQREQMTIDRGNEYVRAVKLYRRKIGHYPASVDQLENTNQMRFLRHRFKDPLTTDGDWRLLHAGPDGALIDSKVNPISTNPNGTTPNGTTPAANTVTASTSTTATSNVPAGDASQTTVLSVPQRPPAISASGGPGEQTAGAADPNASPTTPLLTPAQTTAAATSSQPGAPASATPGPGDAANQAAAQPGTPNGATGTPSTSNVAPGQPQAGSSTPTSGMGVLNSGGIAGVASKAQGHSIKSVNDQSDYSLWEFYYDQRKDTTAVVANAATAPGATPGNPNQTPPRTARGGY